MSVVLSVIIPAYNRCSVIVAAVQSVLQQQLPAPEWSCEIVVVDDGSSDDLEQALAPFGDHVRLLRHKKNAGASRRRTARQMRVASKRRTGQNGFRSLS